MSVVAVSDYSERDEGIMNSLDWALDKMGNPLGMDIPNALKVMDGDSPPVRRLKLIGEAGIFSLFGDALGYVLQRGKGPVEWFTPKDEIAQNYKISAALENPDPFSVKRTHEIDEELDYKDVFGTTGGQCIFEFKNGIPFSYTGTRAAHGNIFGFASNHKESPCFTLY